MVFAEMTGGHLRPVTYELLGAAQDLADRLGGQVASILVGGPSAAEHVRALGAYGADTVYLAVEEGLSSYDTQRYTQAVVFAIGEHQPYVPSVLASPGHRYRPPYSLVAELNGHGHLVAGFFFDSDSSPVAVRGFPFQGKRDTIRIS